MSNESYDSDDEDEPLPELSDTELERAKNAGVDALIRTSRQWRNQYERARGAQQNAEAERDLALKTVEAYKKEIRDLARGLANATAHALNLARE
jgi:hypothetical protein